MKTFAVPSREEVSPSNQILFDNLKKGIGMVPNLYAAMALSQNALASYLNLSMAKSSLKAKEKEVVNLVESQVNSCDYCNSAHTAIGKMNGFTDEQILEIRTGHAGFDQKFDALARFTKSVSENKGHADNKTLEAFYQAGYTDENLVDVLLVIAEKVFTNYLFAITNVPIDFPIAPKLN